MKITEFSEFGIRRRTSENKKPLKLSKATILEEGLLAMRSGLDLKGTESFRVISKESPITELK